MTRMTFAFSMLLAAASLHAQDATAKAAQKQADARLFKSLTKMAALQTCAFATEVSWQQGDGNNPRGAQVLLVGGGGRVVRPGTTEKVEGVWGQELLAATCHSGKDEVVFAGRRQIAREKNGEWKPRSGRLARGQSLPFVLDPQLLFDRLLALEPEVVHAEVSTWNDRPIEILTVTFEGDDAVELLWSGALPDHGGGLQAIMVVNQGGRNVVPKPEVTIDLALFVDPATRLVHEVKVRSYSKAGAMGNRIVAFGGGGGRLQVGRDEEEEEPEGEEEAEGPAFVEGLPVRKSEDRVIQKLDVTFEKHDEAALPELGEQARRLLGLK